MTLINSKLLNQLINLSAKLSLLFACLCFRDYGYSQPVISSFSPTSDTIGTTVSILGTGFNTSPLNNIVYFGGIRATVVSGSQNKLVVKVPLGATYHPISVLNMDDSHLAGFSNKPFIVTYASKNSITDKDFFPALGLHTSGIPRSVGVGDLDGDGKLDVASVDGFAHVSIFRNISEKGSITAASFEAEQTFSTGAYCQFIAINDVDGDGKLDIITCNINSSNVSILLNTSSNGSISFAPKKDISVSQAPVMVALADIDMDGKLDIATPTVHQNIVSIVKNYSSPGNVSFGSALNITVPVEPSYVSFGDLDGDLKPEMIVGYSDMSLLFDSASVFHNVSQKGILGLSSFSSPVNFQTGFFISSIAVSDLDADGKNDLIVRTTDLNILQNKSVIGIIDSNSFNTRVTFNVSNSRGSGSSQVAIADLDGDSKPDIVVSDVANSYPDSGKIAVVKNVCVPGLINAFSFMDRVLFSAGVTPKGVAIGDIDGDEKSDLLIGDDAGKNIVILKNDPQNILPVTFLNFSATLQNQQVLLKWQTTNESENKFFDIEHGIDGIAFSSIGRIVSKSNSATTNSYTFLHTNPINGKNYYRLKQVDINGKISYSKSEIIDFTSAVIKLYPNPVKDFLIIDGLTENADNKLSIIDQKGKVIDHIETNNTNYKWKVSRLASNIYYLRIVTNKKITTLKFIKE